MNTYRHLFFDLDRTLYDFDANNRNALYHLYREYRLWSLSGRDFDYFFTTYRPINLQLWEEYKLKKITKAELNYLRFANTFHKMGINKDITRSFSAKYLSLSPQQTRLVKGTHETLRVLKNKYGLHIITNGFEEIQYQKMDRCGLNDYFDTVITSEAAGVQKPDKRIFQYALEKAGATTAESLMIGDDPVSDIFGAQQFGMDQVWLAKFGETSATTPTHTIRDLRELLFILT